MTMTLKYFKNNVFLKFLLLYCLKKKKKFYLNNFLVIFLKVDYIPYYLQQHLSIIFVYLFSLILVLFVLLLYLIIKQLFIERPFLKKRIYLIVDIILPFFVPMLYGLIFIKNILSFFYSFYCHILNNVLIADYFNAENFSKTIIISVFLIILYHYYFILNLIFFADGNNAVIPHGGERSMINGEYPEINPPQSPLDRIKNFIVEYKFSIISIAGVVVLVGGYCYYYKYLTPLAIDIIRKICDFNPNGENKEINKFYFSHICDYLNLKNNPKFKENLDYEWKRKLFEEHLKGIFVDFSLDKSHIDSSFKNVDFKKNISLIEILSIKLGKLELLELKNNFELFRSFEFYKKNINNFFEIPSSKKFKYLREYKKYYLHSYLYCNDIFFKQLFDSSSNKESFISNSIIEVDTNKLNFSNKAFIAANKSFIAKVCSTHKETALKLDEAVELKSFARVAFHKNIFELKEIYTKFNLKQYSTKIDFEKKFFTSLEFLDLIDRDYETVINNLILCLKERSDFLKKIEKNLNLHDSEGKVLSASSLKAIFIVDNFIIENLIKLDFLLNVYNDAYLTLHENMMCAYKISILGRVCHVSDLASLDDNKNRVKNFDDIINKLRIRCFKQLVSLLESNDKQILFEKWRKEVINKYCQNLYFLKPSTLKTKEDILNMFYEAPRFKNDLPVFVKLLELSEVRSDGNYSCASIHEKNMNYENFHSLKFFLLERSKGKKFLFDEKYKSFRFSTFCTKYSQCFGIYGKNLLALKENFFQEDALKTLNDEQILIKMCQRTGITTVDLGASWKKFGGEYLYRISGNNFDFFGKSFFFNPCKFTNVFIKNKEQGVLKCDSLISTIIFPGSELETNKELLNMRGQFNEYSYQKRFYIDLLNKDVGRLSGENVFTKLTLLSIYKNYAFNVFLDPNIDIVYRLNLLRQFRNIYSECLKHLNLETINYLGYELKNKNEKVSVEVIRSLEFFNLLRDDLLGQIDKLLKAFEDEEMFKRQIVEDQEIKDYLPFIDSNKLKFVNVLEEKEVFETFVNVYLACDTYEEDLEELYLNVLQTNK